MNAASLVTSAPSIRVRTHAKVNLSLRVGPVLPDGYHPLRTVFHAVGLAEDVVATELPAGQGIRVTAHGPQSEHVPLDQSNLVWQAAQAIAERVGLSADVHLHIDKGVPVAGGMAGGSADAAGALLACDALWHAGLSRSDLAQLAATLGADVPFALLGHTAVGTGRGDLLTPVMSQGVFHWAFAVSADGLSTPRVFAEFDELGLGAELNPGHDDDLLRALRAGDASALGAVLHNDLEPVVLRLRPDLEKVRALAHEAGALGVVVSGAGPTVAALGTDPAHARQIAAAWRAAGAAAATHCASGPAPGARIIHE